MGAKASVVIKTLESCLSDNEVGVLVWCDAYLVMSFNGEYI